MLWLREQSWLLEHSPVLSFPFWDWEDHGVQVMPPQEDGDSGSLSVYVEKSPLPAHMAQGCLLTQHNLDHPDSVV